MYCFAAYNITAILNYDVNLCNIFWQSEIIEPARNKVRSAVQYSTAAEQAHKLKSLSNFIAGHPNAALLFWFFGGFRCGA